MDFVPPSPPVDIDKGEEVRLLAPKDVPGLELRVLTNSLRPVERLFLEAYALAVGMVGQARITYRGVHTNVKGPLFQVHQAGEVLSSEPLGGRYTFRSLLIQPALMAELVSQLADQAQLPYFPQLIPEHAGLNRRLTYLELELTERLLSPATPLERQSALLALVAALITTSATRSFSGRELHRERRAVRSVREYLLEHLGQDVAFDELAAVAQLSPYHLIRVFKQEVGITPASFQIQARVQRAKGLLLKMPAALVAAELGFADQAHLIRTFKRYTGVTPGRFARDNH